jgi:hypothetical protein
MLLMQMEMHVVTLGTQVVLLFLIAIPVACISWTLTHEEVFRELHQYCVDRSQKCRGLAQRKFFYALTCEFCLSYYVAALWLVLTRYTLVFEGWRGYLLAGFSLCGLRTFIWPYSVGCAWRYKASDWVSRKKSGNSARNTLRLRCRDKG